VRELPFQRQSRYDANLDPHANLVCLGCGTVVDAEVGQETVAELGVLMSQELDFQVASQRVDFYGWCSRCTPDG
jgi:Fur family peroxide stress response transcriptional regulator